MRRLISCLAIVALLAGMLAAPVFADADLVPVAGLKVDGDRLLPWGSELTLEAVVSAGTDLVYRWDLGDGTIAFGPTVTHVFALPGNYVVAVWAGNDLGAMTAEAIIAVEAPTSVELVQFGDAPANHFWGLWTVAMLAISAVCLLGLAIMWRRGWLFLARNK